MSTRNRTTRRFIGIDGESVTLDKDTPNERHIYVLMRASTGEHIEDARGLTTEQCFRFLLSLRKSYGNAIFCMFGLNYDANMWLGDVDYESVENLYRFGSCNWRSSETETRYLLSWTPAKYFTVSTRRHTPIRIVEVWGLFQSSFVRALESWQVAQPGMIAEMKARRANFTLDDMPIMAEYCLEETRLLVKLMEEVRKALHSVELYPAQWHGAGAIAGTLLRRERVQDHRLIERGLVPELQSALMRAYYGGRVETFAVGNVGDCLSADIRSAYPSVAVSLPSLIGQWYTTNDFNPNLFGVWHVSWNLPPNATLTPFPYRSGKLIYYPTNGEGYYHTSEVSAALKVFGSGITVHMGYVIVPESPELPFAFVESIYREREKLKQEGHASEKVLKLAINSIYGKLAQGLSRKGIPPYQSYLWAGAITAGTRARMLTLASTHRDRVVAIATDGILLRDNGQPLSVEDTPGLGGWELGNFDDVFIAQPGIYAARKSDGSYYTRTRGFFSHEVDWNALRSAYQETGCDSILTTNSTRFVGAGSCVGRSDWTKWRTWSKAERKLSLYPQRKLPLEPVEGYTPLAPPVLDVVDVSGKYVPKGQSGDVDVEYVEGLEQTLRDYGEVFQ